MGAVDEGRFSVWMVLGLVCLAAPVSGPVVEGFAPTGAYSGHWGVDFATDEGSLVTAPVDGTVTFAGNVAGTRSVTIQTGDMKVSVSYLSEVTASAGTTVAAGAAVGVSGVAHGRAGVHLSVRLADRYVDPAPFLACRFRPITEALRLVPYPGGRADRTSRRHLRPASSGPPPYRRGGVPPA